LGIWRCGRSSRFRPFTSSFSAARRGRRELNRGALAALAARNRRSLLDLLGVTRVHELMRERSSCARLGRGEPLGQIDLDMLQQELATWLRMALC